MTVHELKADPAPFNAIWWGMKTADLRRNDRGFEAGDVVQLREWSSAEEWKPSDGYSGCEIDAEVLHVEKVDDWVKGLREPWVVLSLRLLEKREE